MSSHEELLESLERTLAEIEALEAIYGCGGEEEEGTQLFQVVSPPSALERARAMISENNSHSKESIPDLEVKIMCQLDHDPFCSSMLMLQCRLPAGYPAQVAAKVTSISSVDHDIILKNKSSRDSLTEELNQTAVSLIGSEAVMELVECLKESAPKYFSRNSLKEEHIQQASTSKRMTSSTPKLYVISSHHLLDHAPDNFLAKGGKFKLKGVYRFGTPGLGLVVGDNDNTLMDVENFMAALEKKMPQKKFVIALARDHHENDGDTEISGWGEATMDQLRELLTPDEFSTILNIQGAPSSLSSINNSNSKNKSQHGKGKIGKGGKKK